MHYTWLIGYWLARFRDVPTLQPVSDNGSWRFGAKCLKFSLGWLHCHGDGLLFISSAVLSKLWHIELAPVLLKRWSPVFDPELEHLGAGPIWVRLPGLPLHFWSEDVFKHIGNALGTYLDYDKSNMAMARILVDLDKHKGLVENLQIQWRNTCCIQILNYEEVPYRCRGCHKIWPWFNYCPLRTSSSASVSQLDHIVVDIPSGSQDKRPAKTAGHPPKTSAQMHGPREEPVRPPSPRITRSRAAAAAINPGSATSFLTNYPKRPRTWGSGWSRIQEQTEQEFYIYFHKPYDDQQQFGAVRPWLWFFEISLRSYVFISYSCIYSIVIYFW